MTDSEGIVVFRLAGELYGMTLEAVREIGRVPPVTPIPGAEGFVVGVCNLRGNIIALLDLHALFDLGAGEEVLPSHRMLIVSNGDLTAGLLVDGVEGVMEVDEIDPPLAGMPEGLRPYLVGHVRGDSLVAIIDPAILLAMRQRLEAAVA